MIVDLSLSPLAMLIFLGGCLSVVAGFAVLVFARLTGRNRLARIVIIAMVAGAGFYILALLANSAFSKEYVLSASGREGPQTFHQGLVVDEYTAHRP